jgi:single-stranded DNA-binding protein
MFKAELIGNLGADAEIKSGEGYSFVSMRVANTEKWKDEAGNEHTNTDWIDVVYPKTDSALLPFLKSGVKVFVRGFVRLRVYSSQKDRKMKAGMSINATEIELCGGSSDLVPRQLIVPDTGAIVDVAKYYQANIDTSKWKKDDQGYLVDKSGNQFTLVKGGWVAPVVNDEVQQQDSTEAQQ